MAYKDFIPTTELSTKIEKLKQVMKQKEYSAYEIGVMDHVWQRLLIYAEDNPSDKFNEEYRQQFITSVFSEAMESRDSMYRITRAMNMLSDFITFKVIFRQYCTLKTTFSEEFEKGFKGFIASEKLRNLSDNTIKSIFIRLIRFHDYLIDIGIMNFSQITRQALNTYVLSLARYSTTYTSETLRILRKALDFAYKNNYCEESLSDCIPHVKSLRQQKLPNIFTIDEINRILDSVDRNNPIGKRNYAIILMAGKTGLRSSDIRTLKFENIDWDTKTINITQVKTKKYLSLPLLDDVGWAVIDYLKHGRPETECKNIFVSHAYPYGELTTLCSIMPKQMRKAGIKSPVNKRTGMHSFRSSLATRMLEDDIPLTVVSQTLGHADITSTEVYLRISIKQLAKCGLEVEL